MVHKVDEINQTSLSMPNSENPPIFERNRADYKNLSVEYVKPSNDFSKQFAHIYAVRLAELRDILVPRVHSLWGNIQILKLAELEDFDGQRCVIIGTLYKHQQWKPSILRELSEDHQLVLPAPRMNYYSENDQAFLEDEMLRIKLVGKHVDTNNIVTGVVCAILGHESKDGTFIVDDWCFPGCVPKASIREHSTKGKVVFVSGLNLASNSQSLALSLLTEWITGMVGTVGVQKDSASIVRVIIAGNTVKSDTTIHTQKGHSEGKAQDNAIAKEITKAIENTDMFLAEISKTCCITLLPGQHDPTNIMMPQKPLHPCLLPKTSKLESFKAVTNPWVGNVGDCTIIGTSGQPIQDILKVCGESDITPIGQLEKTLIWRHMCPTAPDTLPAYPYYENDPFIMKECPDIYFVGNMERYETKLWKGPENQIVRLICVPEFCTSHTVVCVNLDTLEADFISFGSE